MIYSNEFDYTLSDGREVTVSYNYERGLSDDEDQTELVQVVDGNFDAVVLTDAEENSIYEEILELEMNAAVEQDWRNEW